MTSRRLRRRSEDHSDEVRRRRVALAAQVCRRVHGYSFGDERFLELIGEGGRDLLSHHAPMSPTTRVPTSHGRRLVEQHSQPAGVLEALRAAGGRRGAPDRQRLEGGEGAGSQGLPASPPTACPRPSRHRSFVSTAHAGIGLGKFVIPNPFGPYEEPRFTAYLIRTGWPATPNCSSPAYVRDNIHVSLLAKAYARFAAEFPAEGFTRINPSGYAESQGHFTLRLAQEMPPAGAPLPRRAEEAGRLPRAAGPNQHRPARR